MTELSLMDGYYYYNNPSSSREYNVSFLIDLEKYYSLSEMFMGAKDLTEISFINFDTRNIKIMSKMFYGCEYLNSLNLSSFNTQNVQSMESMFDYCHSLRSFFI